jgi:hypothetical protein
MASPAPIGHLAADDAGPGPLRELPADPHDPAEAERRLAHDVALAVQRDAALADEGDLDGVAPEPRHRLQRPGHRRRPAAHPGRGDRRVVRDLLREHHRGRAAARLLGDAAVDLAEDGIEGLPA